MNSTTVLVTGATGFLGGRLAEELTRQGFQVRALVRNRSNITKLQSLGAGIFYGDVRDVHSLKYAMTGADVVIHAAADTTGNARQGKRITVMGTRNAVDAAAQSDIRQFIYLSSCAVYGIADCKPWERVDENGPLERLPEARGNYSNYKFQAEQIVLEAINAGSMHVTCLRPGTIWGPGGETFSSMMGFRAGRKLAFMIGNQNAVLPLVHLDNLVEAIIKCIDCPNAYNQVFNVVDPGYVTKKVYAREVLKPLFPGTVFLNLPYAALSAGVWCQEKLFRMMKKKPFLTHYRLVSSQRPVVYDAGKLERDTGWRPRVSFREGAEEIIAFENMRHSRTAGKTKRKNRIGGKYESNHSCRR